MPETELTFRLPDDPAAAAKAADSIDRFTARVIDTIGSGLRIVSYSKSIGEHFDTMKSIAHLTDSTVVVIPSAHDLAQLTRCPGDARRIRRDMAVWAATRGAIVIVPPDAVTAKPWWVRLLTEEKPDVREIDDAAKPTYDVKWQDAHRAIVVTLEVTALTPTGSPVIVGICVSTPPVVKGIALWRDGTPVNDVFKEPTLTKIAAKVAFAALS
jgi:hypothetical protein